MSLAVKVSANNNILLGRSNRWTISTFNQKQKPSFAIIPRASMSSASDISIMVCITLSQLSFELIHYCYA